MHLTAKQIQLLGVIVIGNGSPGGQFEPCDLDQIIERVDYKPTKEAIQFSIRNLIGKGLIEKVGTELRRDRRRVVIAPTENGKMLYKAETDPCYVCDETWGEEVEFSPVLGAE